MTVEQISELAQIVFIDISLAADNALTVGLAAAGLPSHQRRKAIYAGLVAATALRILFAIFAVKLMRIAGLMTAGALLLLWVAWKMYKDIRHRHLMEIHKKENTAADEPETVQPAYHAKKLSSAILQIIVADVSMSLDNVLAVAGVARDHLHTLAYGLCLSVLLMGIASSYIARLTNRYHWLGYVGIAIVIYTACRMMVDSFS